MSKSNPSAKPFDVFLCHNGEDKREIRKIAEALEGRDLKPWLDENEIQPGTSWQTTLGEQIGSMKSAAVFVGESGIGPWQNQEIQALLSQFVARQCPVIPVILPSVRSTPKLPWTLANFHWVDFRESYPDPLSQLEWGVTGKKAATEEAEASATMQPSTPEVNLLPSKDKQVIEIRLPESLDSFSDVKKEKILRSLSALLDVGDVKLTREPMDGSVRLHLGLNPEDADKLYAAAMDGRLAELGIVEARLYPAIAVPPDEEQRSQLLILLDRVNDQWVEGVFRNSLHNEVLISLGKRPVDEAVEPPWKQRVELPEQRLDLPLRDRNIGTVFDATGLLLILGEPGSGKTTTMLELASHLVERARGEPKERVPVVLNLSGWMSGQALSEWIATELSAKYRVPVKIARSWLASDYLLPLFDGLDEVQANLQPECVAAINEFIDQFKPPGLVVCCRLMEYQWLPERLKLNGAICLEPLSADEVNTFLASGGAPLASLQKAVTTDPVLQEVSRTPLMLSIMSLAYQNRQFDGESARQKTIPPKERRDQIFALYIDQMFKRKESADFLFPKDNVIGWLSWLARKMKGHSQSVFVVEGLQPSWLGSIGQRVAYGAVVALIVGLAVGLVVALNTRLTVWQDGVEVASGLLNNLRGLLAVALSVGLPVGLLYGLIVGPISALIGGGRVASMNRIRSVEKMSWNWNQFRKQAARVGLIVGLAAGLIVGLMSGVADGLEAGLLFGVVSGLIGGVVGGMTDQVKVDKASPNEGITLSGKNAVVAFVVSCLISSLSTGLIFWVTLNLADGLIFGLLFGAFAGLIVGLNRGGSAVLKHYSLRLMLWLRGYTPFRFIGFLDYSAKLIFLKKVGGSYIFIHRMLLEYFAELNSEAPTRAKDGL